MSDDWMEPNPEIHKPLIINASDIPQLNRTFFRGEHGQIDDPDVFQPVTVGVTPLSPTFLVKADPDGVVLNTASTRMILQVGELEELISALTEAREYLEVHRKDI